MSQKMSRKTFALSSIIALTAGISLAEAPKVAVDIAPVHSLVARVMDGVGTPDLIIPAGASPHEYSLRPSQAASLQNADLVFWIGESLTPWMESAIETLAKDAVVTELFEAEGILKLPFRQGALFEEHADHDDHEGHDDHDEHDDHEGHDEHDDHDGHDEHDDHDGHDHDGDDPHVWLSPDNAAVWLNTIAQALSNVDPENADQYKLNAAEGQKELRDLSTEIDEILFPFKGRNFIVFHDAYQYFEESFNFYAAGAISLSDARDPSPARVAEIQNRINEQSIACILSEPQYNPNIVATVANGSNVKMGILDPLGVGLELGKTHYFQTLRNIATALSGCL